MKFNKSNWLPAIVLVSALLTTGCAETSWYRKTSEGELNSAEMDKQWADEASSSDEERKSNSMFFNSKSHAIEESLGI